MEAGRPCLTYVCFSASGGPAGDLDPETIKRVLAHLSHHAAAPRAGAR
jgi:hypothetical protein